MLFNYLTRVFRQFVGEWNPNQALQFDISTPFNFQHVQHVTVDSNTGDYVVSFKYYIGNLAENSFFSFRFVG